MMNEFSVYLFLFIPEVSPSKLEAVQAIEEHSFCWLGDIVSAFVLMLSWDFALDWLELTLDPCCRRRLGAGTTAARGSEVSWPWEEVERREINVLFLGTGLNPAEEALEVIEPVEVWPLPKAHWEGKNKIILRKKYLFNIWQICSKVNVSRTHCKAFEDTPLSNENQ